MIQNVIFDMGGVLIAWDPARIVARLGLPEEDAKLLRREVFASAEWVSLDRGSLREEEAIARFRERLPLQLHEAVERCVFWWKEPLWPVEGMEELIRELDSLGYGVYLLSNATSALHVYFPRIPGSDCFRGLVVSADWKLLKPERAIYEKLFEEYGLRPEECFFIDDSPLNIDGARCAGMPGTVFFRDMARLRRELNEAGIPVRMDV